MFKKLRRYFFTGIIVLLPVSITVYLMYFIFNFAENSFVGDFINTLFIKFFHFKIPGLGLVLTVLVILTMGMLATNIVGRKILAATEILIFRIPFARSIYKTSKQIIDAFIHEDKEAFQRVVLLEYPRQGLYALAFVTGETKGEAQHKTEEQLLNVFLPTTPNPTSGFLLLVPKTDVIPLKMSVEDGIKMIISGGVVTPPFPEGDVTGGKVYGGKS